jgi:Tfp pilus assembly protein PilN
MFPTRLNLLPPDNQKYLQKMVFTEFIKSTLETILLLLTLTGMAILGGEWVLQGYFNDLTETIVTVSNENSEANNEIRNINMLIEQVMEIQQQYTLWTPFFVDLSSSVPDGVVLSNISIDIKNQLFSLSGTAKKRRDLLDLQHQLELLPYIASLSIPPSQLTKKEDISIHLTATLTENP